MENKIEVTSKQFFLNHKDFFKGLIVSAGSAALTIIYNSIEAGNFDINWSSVLKISLTAGIAYLMKNFFQPAQEKRDITNAEVDQLKGVDKTASK